MKLHAELNALVEKMEAIKDKIEAHAEWLKEDGRYNDFETRLAWDVLRAVVPTSTIVGWYEQYNCKDTHITTLAKRALKQVYTAN